jgi:hypothetical protein
MYQLFYDYQCKRLSVPSSLGNILRPLRKPGKNKAFLPYDVQHFSKPFCLYKMPVGLRNCFLKDIPTEISILAIRAPVSYWRGRGHLFRFDHAPDFLKHGSRLIL